MSKVILYRILKLQITRTEQTPC